MTTQNRAYSVLVIKSIDEEKRIIRGTATTPTTDRVGDIVEPLGVKFKNPMPLLWQHKHDKPVGMVKFDRPTEDGIDFEAQLVDPEKVQSPGLKDRLMEAWDSVKTGLVASVSIGFRALEYAFMKESDGIRFEKTEVYELSLVTIPANAEATIQMIKSLDVGAQQAAIGQNADPKSLRPQRPGATGTTAKTVSVVEMIASQETRVKTIREQITGFEATRAAKAARMKAIMDAAAEAGTTLNQAESEEYDTLEQEVAQIDKHLIRLNSLEKQQLADAQRVEPAQNNNRTVETREQRTTIEPVRARVVGPNANVPKGTAFIRYVMCLAASKGDTAKALNMAKQFKDQMPEIFNSIEMDVAGTLRNDPLMAQKAAIGAGTTTDATWAAPLVAYNIMASEFIGLLRPATILGRIPGLRRVPFNIQMPSALSGTTVNWVGENAPKPVSQMTFGTVTLRWAKAAGIVVLTDELVRFSNPAAEEVVRADLVDAMAQFLDRQFVDPAVAAVTNVSPASITNGVTPVTPSGTTASAFRADIKTLFANYFQNNLSTAGGVFLMTQTQALSLSIMQNALGQSVFPNITSDGGSLLGYPVITSENLGMATGGSPADGGLIIFLKANEIMLADDGQVVIDASNQASVQMDSAPDSPPTASTNMVSLWQMNMTGVRAERWINWGKRRSTAVAFIQNTKYAE